MLRGRRQGKGPAPQRGQGVRGPGRRHDLLPIQCVIRSCAAAPGRGLFAACGDTAAPRS